MAEALKWVGRATCSVGRAVGGAVVNVAKLIKEHMYDRHFLESEGYLMKHYEIIVENTNARDLIMLKVPKGVDRSPIWTHHAKLKTEYDAFDAKVKSSGKEIVTRIQRDPSTQRLICLFLQVYDEKEGGAPGWVAMNELLDGSGKEEDVKQMWRAIFSLWMGRLEKGETLAVSRTAGELATAARHAGLKVGDAGKVGRYNELDYQSFFDDSAHYHRHHDRVDYAHSGPYVDYEDVYSYPSALVSDNSGDHFDKYLVGGVFGGAAIVFILVVFCIGLAFGMVTVCAYMQQKVLYAKGKDRDVYWKANDEENDSNL